jgi:hypothetical protein
MELVKKFAIDRPFPLKQQNIHATKCYNNQKGLVFSMSDILLKSNKLVKQCRFYLIFVLKKILFRNENKGTVNQEYKCTQLAILYACTRKKLLIREATCKENPTKTKLQQPYVHCPATDCVYTFVYKKSFRNHLITCHQYSEGK